MKFSRLSFIFALVLTMAIAGIVLLFDYIKYDYGTKYVNAPLLFFLCVLMFFAITYSGIDILFRIYAKRQLQKMVQDLPEELKVKTENSGFKEFSEKISDFHQTQELQLDMMKEMESYRREYIGNVSHELKTPLFSIQGYVESLRDGAVEDIAIRDRYLERISNSSERLINIVKDLDMINRFQAGEIDLEYSVFDINNLVKDIFGLLELEAEKNKAQLKLVSSQSAIYVNADKQKIYQVLLNLISNAIYYVNRKEATIVVHITSQTENVLVEVEDNGMGIKEDSLPRIFERFYRVETSRNRRDGGSGLGLSIVKHILEAHHQNIHVSSTYLEGTKFSFNLEKSEKPPVVN